MTKILSARDLLELVRQQDAEDRSGEEREAGSRGRKVYAAQGRSRPVVRGSVESRLPMIDADAETDGEFERTKTLEIQLPTPPRRAKTPIIYDISPASPLPPPAPSAPLPPVPPIAPVPPSRLSPIQRTLEMQAPELRPRAVRTTVEMSVVSAPEPSVERPLPPLPPVPPVAPVAPVAPVRPEPPQRERTPKKTERMKAVRPAAPNDPVEVPQAAVSAAASGSASPQPPPGRRPSVKDWARPQTASEAGAELPRSPGDGDIAPPALVPDRLRRLSELPAALAARDAELASRRRPGHDAIEDPVSSTEPLALSSDETMVLLTYDVRVPFHEVVERTGLTGAQVTTIVDKLYRRGVLAEVTPDVAERARVRREQMKQRKHETYDIDYEPPPSLEQMAEDADLAVPIAQPSQPGAFVPHRTHQDDEDEADDTPSDGPPSDVARPSGALVGEKTYPEIDRDLPAPVSGATEELLRNFMNDVAEELPAYAAATPALKRHMIAGQGGPDSAGPVSSGTQPAFGEDDTPIDADPPESSETPASRAAPDDEERGGIDAWANYQRHYEISLAHLVTDERSHIAATGSGADLFALTFDKEAGVTRALWENAGINVEHARFAAFHHRTAFGLDRIVDRGEFARDPQVHRRLIRNPMLSEPALRRLLNPKRLIDVYKIMLDRDVPERTRHSARGVLRTKFGTAEPEDRVQLIWNTEGRVLQYMTGLTIDSKAASIICGRPIVSVMLVQSFCKFSATPPSIIHHCLKQPMIRRQAHLRNQLLKHPNCPTEAKRAF